MTTSKTSASADQESGGITLAGRRRSLVSSTAGNILEWYEWSTYSVMAPFIAIHMFNNDVPTSALLSVFAVFAVGFLMRPFGGIFFGRLGDRIGRKSVLILTMLLMAASCFAIGLTPSFETIGVWASVLILLLRCLQGFAHGGESTASLTYVAEIAPAERRGLWSSLPAVAIIGGSILAFVVSAVLTNLLGDDTMSSWGWRIPFWLGGVMALVVLWMRRTMHESDVFEEDQAAPEDRPVVSRSKVIRTTIRMIAFTSGLTCMNYVWMTYMTTYAITAQSMDRQAAFWATAIGQTACLIALPFMGAISDRIGRKPMMFAFAVLTFATTIPFQMLVGPEPWTLALPVGLSLIFWAMPQSVQAAVHAENFPTYMRSRGVGFAYSISVALFGGTAPYLNQLFVGLDMTWVFSLYVMLLCAVTFVSALFFRETKGADLNKLKL